MAFTLASFLMTCLMLLVMLSQFFAALDDIVVISDVALTLTLLDFMCLTYAFYEVYDFIDYLRNSPSKKKKKSD